jgi:hypothetical protein
MGIITRSNRLNQSLDIVKLAKRSQLANGK